MRCISPITVRKPIPGKSRSVETIGVPCGRCAACLSNRREEWRVRLAEESKDGLFNYFITLTYDESNIVYGASMATLVKSDAQGFIKRLRAAQDYAKKGKIRFYLVGEYGTRTHRPHYHIILFSASVVDGDVVNSCWGKGNTLTTPITEARISYCAKFHVNKGCYPQGSCPPFALMSKGIGKNYVEKMWKFHRNSIEHMYVPDFNLKRKMPRYYKDKLYTKEEREKMAMLYDGSLFDQKKIDEFNRRHPRDNYFADVYARYKNFQEKFKDKSNFNNVL